MRAARRLGAGALALLAIACGTSPSAPPPTVASDARGEPAVAPAAATPAAVALLARLECARCHDGTGAPEVPAARHCVRCHQQLHEGTFRPDGVAAADLARWRTHATSLLAAPDLRAARRLRRDYVERFLAAPEDARPHLAASMPRLALAPDEITLLAAHLTEAPSASDHDLPPGADAARGAALYQARACASCHGALAAEAIPTREQRLAPDLTLATRRMTPAMIARWIANPGAVSPGAAMPALGIETRDAADLAAYVVTLGNARATATPGSPTARPRPLARPVAYQEIEDRILHKVCWHCHGAPHYAHGDGGPGNTGGFGFAPRGLDLSSYEGISSGAIDLATGRRRSVLAPLPDGTPRIVAHLLARHDEVAGRSPALRGMPLGLPPIPLEDIALLEAWIEQGRPLE